MIRRMIVNPIVAEVTADTRAAIDKLDAKVDAQGQRLEAVIDKLDAKVDAQGQRLEAKVDKLDAKVDAQGRSLQAEISATNRNVMLVMSTIAGITPKSELAEHASA